MLVVALGAVPAGAAQDCNELRKINVGVSVTPDDRLSATAPANAAYSGPADCA